MNCDNAFWLGLICGMVFYLICHAMAHAPGMTTTDQQTVPCKYCGTATMMTATEMCDGCWQMNSGLPGFLRHTKARVFVRELLNETEITHEHKPSTHP